MQGRSSIQHWDNAEGDKYFEEQTHQESSLILNKEDDSSNDDEHSSLEIFLPPSVRRIKAIKSNNCEDWLKAIKKELQTMIDLNVWEEVSVKDSYKLIGTTWVFKTKRDGINNLFEHKARLCAQGFSQTQGKDYSKTFASTSWLNSLRALISHAAAKNISFEQLDKKVHFLTHH
ncbi:hypothetical protein O181_070491 [Austropuccinia psidii MF-1]|uniref:Reverse transcriptase Ty1/copia-type domain-containing protein n=1 Tax=Austropuccinia psidii MF-1 TaxID=1389203 RepID=A0A9Q3EYV5_9BASI|nr:hypothetical protein [Austropuccinia psidii MF-1]